ncbi:hypothetical protein [Shewanella baltica]|uniref:hypothetical protein n=1 Tax=Shewanella baltica TaxID=62322 RepID=UPI00217D8ACC|nr:hypothetical protein [Shewanella baltica]
MDICSLALLAQVPNSLSLQQELNALLLQDWLLHINQRDYRQGYQGGWDVLPLRCKAEYQTAHPILQAFSISTPEHWQDLPRLESNPTLCRFLQSLACPVKSLRLMGLHVVAEIKHHKDKGIDFELNRFGNDINTEAFEYGSASLVAILYVVSPMQVLPLLWLVVYKRSPATGVSCYCTYCA